jgi:hypothetical protein
MATTLQGNPTLPSDTVSCRISDTSEDLKEMLVENTRNEQFSIQLVRRRIALDTHLITCIRYVNENKIIEKSNCPPLTFHANYVCCLNNIYGAYFGYNSNRTQNWTNFNTIWPNERTKCVHAQGHCSQWTKLIHAQGRCSQRTKLVHAQARCSQRTKLIHDQGRCIQRTNQVPARESPPS